MRCSSSIMAPRTAPGEYLPPSGIAVIENETRSRLRRRLEPRSAGIPDSEWVVILNNDVIVSPGGLGLLGIAEGRTRRGESRRSEKASTTTTSKTMHGNMSRMEGCVRRGAADGICFMVRRRVFETIGCFRRKFQDRPVRGCRFFPQGSMPGSGLGQPAALSSITSARSPRRRWAGAGRGEAVRGGKPRLLPPEMGAELVAAIHRAPQPPVARAALAGAGAGVAWAHSERKMVRREAALFLGRCTLTGDAPSFLIVSFRYIGDLLVTTPLAFSIKQRYPKHGWSILSSAAPRPSWPGIPMWTR